MPSLRIRFDANALKNDVYAIAKRKVKSVIQDDELYISLAEAFLDELRDTDIIPKETGALRFAKTTNPGGRKNVTRIGKTYIQKSIGHDYGVVMSAVQYYDPVTERGRKHRYSYGAKAVENELSKRGFSTVSEAFKASNKWSTFVEKAARLIYEDMKES